MRPFVVIMLEILGDDVSERSLTEEDEVAQAFLFDGPHVGGYVLQPWTGFRGLVNISRPDENGRLFKGAEVKSTRIRSCITKSRSWRRHRKLLTALSVSLWILINL